MHTIPWAESWLTSENMANHTSLSKSRRERTPRRAPIECLQQSVSANPKQDPQPFVRNKTSREPWKHGERCNPWRKTTESPGPWRKRPWTEGIQLRTEANPKMNRRSGSRADHGAWIRAAWLQFRVRARIRRFPSCRTSLGLHRWAQLWSGGGRSRRTPRMTPLIVRSWKFHQEKEKRRGRKSKSKDRNCRHGAQD